MDIEKIDFKKELTNMDVPQMQELSEEIRKFLVEKVSATGGHLASNLGVVELTIALHTMSLIPHRIASYGTWDTKHTSIRYSQGGRINSTRSDK